MKSCAFGVFDEVCSGRSADLLAEALLQVVELPQVEGAVFVPLCVEEPANN